MGQQQKFQYRRRKAILEKALLLNDEVLEQREEEAKKKLKTESCIHRLHKRTRKDWDKDIDFVGCMLIVINTVVIGLSVDKADGDKWDVWHILDIMFAVLFLLEFVLKLSLHGVYGFFCRHRAFRRRLGTVFDSILVMLDLATVTLALAMHSSRFQRVASVFRVVRLARMLRLIRVFKMESTKGLTDMLHGIYGGALTLVWAVLLFLLLVYMFAVYCRVAIGVESESHLVHLYPYFNSVPRSMFTIFRCCFGDCNSTDGISIPEQITYEYGGMYALMYAAFIFFIVVGMFNTISAIFVESTLSAAAETELNMARRRLHDPAMFATRIAIILKELLGIDSECRDLIEAHGLVGALDKIVHVEFTREELDEMVQDDKKVAAALHDLDIDSNDYRRLSDILDPDHSGTVGVLELVEGLRRLRGAPRRSDVVSIDLMIRSLQERVEEVLEHVSKKPRKHSRAELALTAVTSHL